VRARILACELLAASVVACGCFGGCDTGAPTVNQACVGTSPTARPSDGPTVTDLSNTVTSGRSLAVICGTDVTFLDPLTGARRETVTPSVASVVKVLLVDVDGGDTLVVFFYNAGDPQDGLTPAGTERRVQVRSRATGERLLDRSVVLPGERTATGAWIIERIVGVDPRGYVALNLGSSQQPARDITYLLPLRPGLAGWSKTQDHPSLTDPSLRGLAVHRGVVLVSRVAEESAGLEAYDVATGRRVWQRRFGVQSLTVPQHPACAVGLADTFVVMGRWVPLVLDVRSGRSRAGLTYRTCMKIDPVRPNGAYGGSGRGGALVVVNLTNGEQRFTVETERAEALGIELVSVYDDRVYVTTRSGPGVVDRLVLDARTGREIPGGWLFAPVEHHDGWTVAYDPTRDANVVLV
jgi:hypothetical protein